MIAFLLVLVIVCVHISGENFHLRLAPRIVLFLKLLLYFAFLKLLDFALELLPFFLLLFSELKILFADVSAQNVHQIAHQLWVLGACAFN